MPSGRGALASEPRLQQCDDFGFEGAGRIRALRERRLVPTSQIGAIVKEQRAIAEAGNALDEMRRHEAGALARRRKLPQDRLDFPGRKRIEAIERFVENYQRGRAQKRGGDRELGARPSE